MPRISFFLASTLALAGAVDLKHWSPPGPGDVRSPCPGLNTLANHGLLPHSGKGMTVPILRNAIATTYNFDPTFAAGLAVAGLAAAPKPNSTSFDLDDLDKHNVGEFDCSLSRHDYYDNGDDHTFVQHLFDTVLAFYAGRSHTDIPSTAKGRYARVKDEHRTDPNITYGMNQYIMGNGATSLFLSVLGDPVNGSAPVEFVRIFFEQERLPVSLGWHTPTQQINSNTVGAMVKQLMATSGEPVPSDLVVTNTTYTRALFGLDLLSDDIPTHMQAMLSQYGVADLL